MSVTRQSFENPGRRHAWPAVAALIAVLAGSGAAVVAQVFRAPQGTAENLRFEQAAGGVVTITYDLRSDDPNAVFSIVLEVSGPGGAPITPSSTTGDIGPGVRPGLGKRIVWAASRDVEDLQIGQFKFNVRASAGAGVPVTPPPAATGRLAVTSTPAGAAVYVDGVQRGTTPLTLPGLAVGAHTVRLVRDGYLEHQRSVTVAAGAEAVVDVRLTAPPPAPAGTTAAPTGASQPAAQVNSGGGSKKWLWIGLAGAGVAGGAVALSGGGSTSTTGGGTGGTGGTGGGGGGGGTPPPTCTFAVANLANVTVPPAAQSITRRVAETNAPCTGGSWTASATQPWITLSPSSGTAAADVAISVAANTGGQRTAQLTIAGTTAQVTQDALACTYRANFVGGDGVPPNSSNTAVPGDCSGSGCGTRLVDVQASDASCVWTVDNTPSWFAEIERPSPGSRTIRFQVYERNTTGRDRSASFRVAGVNFTVTQCAGRCP